MKLSFQGRNSDHLRTLKLWFKELRDDPDGRVSLQHEVIGAILALRHTREKDGWCNWNESYHDHIDTLDTWLAHGDQTGRIQSDVAAVKKAGDSGGEFADEELERLTTDAFLWCRTHPDAILMPEGCDFWSEVPPGTFQAPTSSGSLRSLIGSIRGWLSVRG